MKATKIITLFAVIFFLSFSPHENNLMSIMNKMMKNMKEMKISGNPDYDFSMMMKTHHQGAIDISRSELQNGKNSEIKKWRIKS